VKADFSPDMPVIDAMAEYLGIHLPEINVVDFFRSGYLPEAVANFVSLLGWTPGDDREIMRRDEVIEAFDISRITKSNSLFDRKKLVAFNTEHMKMLDEDTLLGHFKEYLNETGSPVLRADDDTLRGLLKITEGARTLAEVETKCRFLFLDEDELEYDPKAVKKVLLKKRGLEMLGYVRQRLGGMEQISEQSLEAMLRSLAEEQEVGLGKVAQPVRVAITGTTISPPIFESVRMLGKERTLARMDRTIEKFTEKESEENRLEIE
jgi:glutamyl-tRNA synthetase